MDGTQRLGLLVAVTPPATGKRNRRKPKRLAHTIEPLVIAPL